MKAKYKNIAIAVGLIVVIGFIFIGSSSNDNKKVGDNTAKMRAKLQATQPLTTLPEEKYVPLTNLPTTTISSTSVANTDISSKNMTDRINKLVAEKFPHFEVTIWNQKDELASEGESPYEVILNSSLNDTIVTDCNFAKMLSYDMLETLYKDNVIRPILSRVKITVPYYLTVSLGANDGVPMAEHDSFSGQTNFWTVMEKMGLVENETGKMKNRTWGTYLTKCQ